MKRLCLKRGYIELVNRILEQNAIVLFHLNTPEASQWVEENVTAEAQFFGTALVVEPRYVAALVAGMREDGLYEVRS